MERNAAVALVLAVPITGWCLVGDLSEADLDGRGLDYMLRVPQLPRALELAVGFTALAVAATSIVVLVRALAAGRARRKSSATVVPLAVAGAVVSYGGRIVSAGGYGANIGGALMIMLGGPLVLALVVAATWNAVVERRR